MALVGLHDRESRALPKRDEVPNKYVLRCGLIMDKIKSIYFILEHIAMQPTARFAGLYMLDWGAV